MSEIDFKEDMSDRNSSGNQQIPDFNHHPSVSAKIILIVEKELPQAAQIDGNPA